MTRLDWTEWAAIYLAGYNDARSCAHKMTPSDLSMAWETYKAKRPIMQATDPRNPDGCRWCGVVGCGEGCATWEASQVMTYDEIRQLVDSTIMEIVSDEP